MPAVACIGRATATARNGSCLAATELQSRILEGNVAFDGDYSKDTPGSDLIKSLLLDEGDEPLFLLAWGGMSTVARALKSIEDEHSGSPGWPALRDRVSRKAVLQSFMDQDDSYTGYIQPRWPQLRYRNMATRTWGYMARAATLPADRLYLGAAWTRDNVSRQGPLDLRGGHVDLHEPDRQRPARPRGRPLRRLGRAPAQSRRPMPANPP